MDGPWYECQGPNAKYVREDVLSYITPKISEIEHYENEFKNIKENAILKIIPDDRNDFGSFRGYATFGMKQKIAKKVLEEIKVQISYLILKNKFIPYIKHYLYKPDGIRMKKISKTTMVGKSIS
tara:strand:- start:1000 stop:1371 length:372 start_codon:yes stop_codon:yes gene_type:complete